MKLLTSSKILRPKSPAAMAAEIFTITACMAVALPCALALQPQTMALNVASLEPEFQGRRDARGEEIVTVYASKGL